MPAEPNGMHANWLHLPFCITFLRTSILVNAFHFLSRYLIVTRAFIPLVSWGLMLIFWHVSLGTWTPGIEVQGAQNNFPWSSCIRQELYSRTVLGQSVKTSRLCFGLVFPFFPSPALFPGGPGRLCTPDAADVFRLPAGFPSCHQV